MEETIQHEVRYDRPPPYRVHPGYASRMDKEAEAMKPGGCIDKLTRLEKISLVRALKARRWPCTSKKEGHTFTVWRLKKVDEGEGEEE